MSRHIMALLALAALPGGIAAQKKPVTIESLFAEPQERAGRRSAGPVWAPDGRRFAVNEQGTIVLYDVASGEKKDLIKLAVLAEKAVKTAPAQGFDWQNRGVVEHAFEWSASGREMLIANGGDLFLLHVDTGLWEQLTATSEAERDPKLSPDARYVSFRRRHDLYVVETGSRKVTRLTTDGSATLLNGELDWVYPEELDLGDGPLVVSGRTDDRVSPVRREPRAHIPARLPASDGGAIRAATVPAAGHAECGCAAGDCPGRRRRGALDRSG